MKSGICIIGVFFLGLFGWLGFESKVEKKAAYVNTKEILYENDLRIREAEKKCESLKAQIIENHEIIETKINE